MHQRPLALLTHLAVPLISATLIGCSLLLGNVRPVEEKSETYSHLNLSQLDAIWESQSTESDIEYQSKKTSSTISLNSTCRESWKKDPPTLETSVRQLTLGFSEVENREAVVKTLGEVPALQTTFLGNLSNKRVNVQLVTIQKSGCLYDLVHIAPAHLAPEVSNREQAQFNQFVETLKLK